MLKGFKEFVMRGNVVDLAVGVVIGAAFGTVIDSIVKGLIDPIVALILPGSVGNLSEQVWTLGSNPSIDPQIMWGSIVSTLITFLATAFAIYFFVVMPMNALAARRKTGDEETEPTNEEKIVSLLEQIASK